MTEDQALVTTSELAEHLDITVQRLGQLEKMGLFQKQSRGRWERDKCRIAFIRWLREQATGRGSKSEEQADYETERARLTKMKADVAEMDRDARRGQLLESKLVQKVLIDIHSSFKAKILALPNKTAPRVEGVSRLVDIQRILTEDVHQCLKEIANHDPSEIIARIVEEYVSTHHPDDGAAADPDGESVG